MNFEQLYSNLLELKSKRFNYYLQLLDAKKIMHTLLAIPPNAPLDLSNITLSAINFTNNEEDLPLFVLANRPDLLSAMARVNSAFYDYKVSQKGFFPSITIGAALSNSRTNNLKENFSLDFFSGNLKIELPFLDYARVKANLRISKASFDNDLNDYKSLLNRALNELNFYYKNFKINKSNLENLNRELNAYQKIATIYSQKVKFGKSEIKDYLIAQNNVISTQILIIFSKYNTLKDELGIYKSLGGKIDKNQTL